MSRVSLSRRLAAVLDAAEQIDPIAAKVHRLPDALRLRYDLWRTRCAEIKAEYDSGGIYDSMISGELVLPDPTRTVAEALGFERPPVLPDTLSMADLSEIYGAMCQR